MSRLKKLIEKLRLENLKSPPKSKKRKQTNKEFKCLRCGTSFYSLGNHAKYCVNCKEPPKKPRVPKNRLHNPEHYLFSLAKGRAKRNHIPFDIEVSDIVIPAVCPVLGIPLKHGVGRHTNYSPTLDKIIPSKGYTKGNVVVISWRANRLKSNATIQEIKAIAAFYAPFETGVTPPIPTTLFRKRATTDKNECSVCGYLSSTVRGLCKECYGKFRRSGDFTYKYQGCASTIMKSALH